MRNRVLKISPDGAIVSGLQADFMSGLGQQQMCRASSVEFDHDLNRWTVEFRIGPFSGACLLQTFEKRADALAAEVCVLNKQHACGLLL